VFASVVALIIIVPLVGTDSDNGTNAPWTGSHVLNEVPLVDGHNDFPFNLYELEHNQINNFDFDSDLKVNPKWENCSTSHTDLPRLRAGKVGGQVILSLQFSLFQY
jgi:membrane dipeptidase